MKLQPTGEQDTYGNTLCAVKLHSESIPAPVSIGVYTSIGFAEVVAKELLEASEKEKSYYQMPPSSVSTLKLLRHIEAAQSQIQ